MPKTKKRRKKKKKTKKRISPEEKQKRRIARKHKTDIRTTLINCGFEHIPTRDQTIEVARRSGELDAIFVHENILAVVEDTTIASQRDIVDHLRKKKEYYQHINEHIKELFDVLKKMFPKFRGYMRRQSQYQWGEFKIVYIYCSLNPIDERYKNRHSDVCKFLDYPYLRYFLSLSRTIHKSARFELVKFLGLELRDIGSQRSACEITSYNGLLLPETASSFPSGHKLVSFLVDPNMLLERAYVLRTDSWRDTDCLYQRLLLKSKIQSMRKYLVKEGRVFINNIIATLPNDIDIKDERGNTIENPQANRIMPISIEIPRAFNSIGIIDGQHRLYSYHEGDDQLDNRINVLRQKQHLLITGIIYPPQTTKAKKQRFEAQLFLEINDRQKRVKGDLKQAIERIVDPYSAIAISKAVISKLAMSGPLLGKLEVHFYDTGKIKTTSIVSYGIKHIVGLDSEHSLFKQWRGTGKNNIRKSKDILNSYIDYCTSEIKMLIEGYKQALPEDMWTTDRKVSRALTTTTINGLIFCLRKLIENKKRGNFDYYERKFKKIKVSFKPEEFLYKSSHWKDLGEKIYSDCFE